MGWLIAGIIGFLIGIWLLAASAWYLGLPLMLFCAIPIYRFFAEKARQEQGKQQAAQTQASLTTFMQQAAPAPEPPQPEARKPQEPEQLPPEPRKRQWFDE